MLMLCFCLNRIISLRKADDALFSREALNPSEQFSRHNFRCNVIEKNEMHADRVTGINENKGMVGSRKRTVCFATGLADMLCICYNWRQCSTFHSSSDNSSFKQQLLCQALGHRFYFLVQHVVIFPCGTPFTNVHLAPDYWQGLLNGM